MQIVVCCCCCGATVTLTALYSLIAFIWLSLLLLCIFGGLRISFGKLILMLCLFSCRPRRATRLKRLTDGGLKFHYLHKEILPQLPQGCIVVVAAAAFRCISVSVRMRPSRRWADFAFPTHWLSLGRSLNALQYLGICVFVFFFFFLQMFMLPMPLPNLRCRILHTSYANAPQNRKWEIESWILIENWAKMQK